ncbi:MAG: heme biosynthesis HemY N-terminal domain-containing protein [Granulosicoccaceae bacterium]|jgi:HemY protein
MKWLFRALIVAVLGVLIAVFAREDTGYVLITREPWVIETSLIMFILILLAAFALLYGVLRFIVNAWGVSRRVHDWQARRRARRARKALNRGLLELAQRNWAKAEKLLLKEVAESDTPLINYIGAATAAQEQGADQRRDEYLQLAYASMPDADVAVGLTQADLQFRAGQLEQAVATLRHLRQVAPKHKHVLKLLLKLYLAVRDWDSILELLPALRRHKVEDEQTLDTLEAQAWEQQLSLVATGQLEQLQAVWKSLPRKLRHDVRIAHRYAQALAGAGEGDRAAAVLRDVLKKHWHPALVYEYGLIEAADKNTQLTEAEHWLAEHGKEGIVLLTLGRLAIRNELWGKARAWLEASLGSEPRTDTCQLLGELLDKLGEKERAVECYRRGLALAGATVPPLPKPAGFIGASVI